jgi:hypothetical protein
MAVTPAQSRPAKVTEYGLSEVKQVLNGIGNFQKYAAPMLNNKWPYCWSMGKKTPYKRTISCHAPSPAMAQRYRFAKLVSLSTVITDGFAELRPPEDGPDTVGESTSKF